MFTKIVPILWSGFRKSALARVTGRAILFDVFTSTLQTKDGKYSVHCTPNCEMSTLERGMCSKQLCPTELPWYYQLFCRNSSLEIGSVCFLSFCFTLRCLDKKVLQCLIFCWGFETYSSPSSSCGCTDTCRGIIFSFSVLFWFLVSILEHSVHLHLIQQPSCWYPWHFPKSDHAYGCLSVYHTSVNISLIVWGYVEGLCHWIVLHITTKQCGYMLVKWPSVTNLQFTPTVVSPVSHRRTLTSWGPTFPMQIGSLSNSSESFAKWTFSVTILQLENCVSLRTSLTQQSSHSINLRSQCIWCTLESISIHCSAEHSSDFLGNWCTKCHP